jgi:hypothetical protein
LENPPALNGTIVDPGCDACSSRMVLSSMVRGSLPRLSSWRFPAKACPGLDPGWTSGSPLKTRQLKKT